MSWAFHRPCDPEQSAKASTTGPHSTVNIIMVDKHAERRFYKNKGASRHPQSSLGVRELRGLDVVVEPGSRGHCWQ